MRLDYSEHDKHCVIFLAHECTVLQNRGEKLTKRNVEKAANFNFKYIKLGACVSVEQSNLVWPYNSLNNNLH